MPKSNPNSAVISGTGLYTPEHVITNAVFPIQTINGNNVATPTVLTSGDVISIGDDLFELSIFNDGDQEEVITNKISDGDLDE